MNVLLISLGLALGASSSEVMALRTLLENTEDIDLPTDLDGIIDSEREKWVLGAVLAQTEDGDDGIGTNFEEFYDLMGGSDGHRILEVLTTPVDDGGAAQGKTYFWVIRDLYAGRFDDGSWYGDRMEADKDVLEFSKRYTTESGQLERGVSVGDMVVAARRLQVRSRTGLQLHTADGMRVDQSELASAQEFIDEALGEGKVLNREEVLTIWRKYQDVFNTYGDHYGNPNIHILYEVLRGDGGMRAGELETAYLVAAVISALDTDGDSMDYLIDDIRPDLIEMWRRRGEPSSSELSDQLDELVRR
jgi:hypothetical protein